MRHHKNRRLHPMLTSTSLSTVSSCNATFARSIADSSGTGASAVCGSASACTHNTPRDPNTQHYLPRSVLLGGSSCMTHVQSLKKSTKVSTCTSAALATQAARLYVGPRTGATAKGALDWTLPKRQVRAESNMALNSSIGSRSLYSDYL